MSIIIQPLIFILSIRVLIIVILLKHILSHLQPSILLIGILFSNLQSCALILININRTFFDIMLINYYHILYFLFFISTICYCYFIFIILYLNILLYYILLVYTTILYITMNKYKSQSNLIYFSLKNFIYQKNKITVKNEFLMN